MKNTIQKSVLSTNLIALVFVLCGAQLLHAQDDATLINITNLEQLDAMRYDLGGDGVADDVSDEAVYQMAFSGLATGSYKGYELMVNVDFEVASSYASSTINMDWTTGSGWEPIGIETNGFTAIFKGNGHTISNLFIERSSTSYVGLFGHVGGSSAELRNIGLLDVEVTGDDYVGGLVGNNGGDISGSYATGSVMGTGEHVGGLVGRNFRGTVLDSYATGAVTGNSIVGGLVGENNGGDISGSYATGAVTGVSDVGGLVGINEAGTVTASYYNSQTTGQSDTGKGEGKTTAELLTPTVYMGIYGEWDDVADHWDFGTNGQYPVLKIDVDGNGTSGDLDDLRAQRPLRFRQTSYAFAILNTASVNDVVGVVRAVPEDANNELTYSMDTSAEFSISSEAETDNPSKVGQISVKVTLSTNTYTLKVEVMEAGGGQATVEVKIKVVTPLIVDPSTLTFVATGEGKDFTITTNEDWTANSNQDWLTLSSGSGNASMTITTTALENLSAERMATITITSGTLTQTITVTQGAGTQTELLAGL